MTLPLFALIIVLLIVGVVIGGVAAWLRQGNWRRAARRLERELRRARAASWPRSRASAGGGSETSRDAAEPAARLRLRPPAR